jgi:hypothetical protein
MKNILLVIVTLLAAPTAALAQPAETAVRENIPAAPFLAGAYAFIWVAVLVYVGLVAKRLTRVQGDLEDMRRKLDRELARDARS